MLNYVDPLTGIIRGLAVHHIMRYIALKDGIRVTMTDGSMAMLSGWTSREFLEEYRKLL